MNFGKVKTKGETTWCVFEHHPVLSRANVQGVINRWSQSWSEAIKYHSIPKVRVAWRIGLKPPVVRLRSNAARAIQNLREMKQCRVLCVRICLFLGSVDVSIFNLPLCVPSLWLHLKPARVSRTCNFGWLLWVIFNFSFFSQLRMMRAQTWFKISSRSVVPRIFTLTTSAHLSG